MAGDKEQDEKPTVGTCRKPRAGQDIQTTASSFRQAAGITWLTHSLRVDHLTLTGFCGLDLKQEKAGRMA